MKKLALLVFVVGYLLQTVSAMEAKKMMVFSYEKPYQYELINGTYKVKATIKNESWIAGSIVKFNTEELKVTKLENGDMQILLPLIGNSGIITVKKGKKNIISTQHFEPLIPADWDYFADGKIHLIVSSHQDIGWMDVPDTCRKGRVHDITIPALDLMEKEP